MKDVSIILVNWNTKDLLAGCLSSLKEGAGIVSYEVIVLDNDSSDGSPEFIEQNFPELKLIRNTVNIGFAAGCNKAAAIASGKYLFLLNPDTMLTGGCLEILVKNADNIKWAGALGPRLIGRDGKTQNSVRHFPRLGRILVRDTVLKRVIPLYKKERVSAAAIGKYPLEVDQVSGAAFLIGKQLWDALRGMDERFFMFYEEVDLCRRLKDLGYNSYYIPAAEVFHSGGGSRHKDKSKVFYYSVRSMFLYLEKYEKPVRLFFFKIAYKPLFILELILGISNKPKRDFITKYLKDFIRF